MAVVTETVELLGKGLYTKIPDVLTIKAIPTASELDITGAEDFDAVMLDKILPKAVEEEINFRDLLELDYNWLLRCLRILNYGPYHTTNAIFCASCGNMSHGEYRVNLQTIECIPLPEGFEKETKISSDEFIDFEGDVTFSLPTIQQALDSRKDKAFQRADGTRDRELARLCYCIRSIKGKRGLTPIDVKMMIQRDFSPADYVILKAKFKELSNFGLRAGGSTQCPSCGDMNATYMAMVDDRFFRPTLGDLRAWRDDRRKGSN